MNPGEVLDDLEEYNREGAEAVCDVDVEFYFGVGGGEEFLGEFVVNGFYVFLDLGFIESVLYEDDFDFFVAVMIDLLFEVLKYKWVVGVGVFFILEFGELVEELFVDVILRDEVEVELFPHGFEGTDEDDFLDGKLVGKE